MEHKAFQFDWTAFEKELLPIIKRSLLSNSINELEKFIGENIDNLTDPYEGESLEDNWQSLIENNDAHELSDFALTKYYDPIDDSGIGHHWMEISDNLAAEMQSALLGATVGEKGNELDPGRMGSYFQSQKMVSESLKLLATQDDNRLSGFLSLLRSAEQNGVGIYVSF